MSENEIIAWLQKVLGGDTPALPANNDRLITDTLQLADWHGVTALIHHKLSRDNNLVNYPAEFIKQLSARNNQIIAGTMLWTQEMIKLQRSLHAARLKSLLIKGFPLSYTLYPEPHLRLYSDIDILFPDQKSAEKAWNILEKTGYTRKAALSGKYISHQFSCYRTGSSGFSWVLDMHWRINNHYFFANALTFDELNSSSVPLTGLNPEMRTLSPEYALLFACIHRIAHTPYAESNRLVWLYDIHLLAESFNPGQWSRFSELAMEKKLSSISADGLLNSKIRFNTILAENILKFLQFEGANDPIQAVDLSSAWKYHLGNLHTMPGWAERFCFLREHLFPPSEYMLEKYNRQNKLWLPILYVSRFAGGFMKLFKRSRKKIT